jgi:hypothetical protein
LAATPAASVFKRLLSYDSTDPFIFNGDSGALIRNFNAKENKGMTPEDINAVASSVDGNFSGLGASVLPTFKDSIDYLMAREVVQIYLGSTDESTVAAAASGLVGQKSASPINLSPLSTLLLPGAVGTSGATNWGVSRVGDGQQVLTGITGIGGNTP